MVGIYEKLKIADMVVVASPVYFYGIGAQLKAVIDRLHTPIFDAIKLQYQLILNFFH